MASKVKYIEFSNIEEELKKFVGMKIIAGVAAEEKSKLAQYAGANEYGATINPKKGKFLAIPLQPEYKNKSPKDFPSNYFRFVPHDPKNICKGATLKLGDVDAFALVRQIKIPERAFIRNAFDNKKTQDKVHAFARQGLERIFNGKGTAQECGEDIGEFLKSSIKTSIESNTKPENSSLTKRLKTSNKTLIDSGELLNSIEYEVVGCVP